MTQKDHDLLTKIDTRLEGIETWMNKIEKKIEDHIKEHTKNNQWTISQIIVVVCCVATIIFNLWKG